ncbi:MAG: HAMP domain-containing histidine kinase [Ruminococcaceae bacterium]|nr:HAMP domain-containing histidine kinase [Oscillospiraceae bacterium]
MFKSVFSKYVTAFMLIIVVSFLVVLIITAAAIGRFSNDIKQEVVINTAETSELYFSSLLYSSDASGLSDLDEIERAGAEEVIKNISLNVEDVSTVIMDKDGNVVFSYLCENTKMAFEGEVSTDFLSEIAVENIKFLEGDFSGFFTGANVLCGAAIENSEGEVCGYVFSCSDSIMMAELWELMFKIVMGAILWVLLAALIAVYFISERVIAPLREISNAAKSFAKGKFDVRVPVHGKDEVAELAETFNNMAESLNNYDNMRNTFMSDVSHDLRSPMTSIAGFIDGILDGVIPPEQHEYYLKVVSNEVHRLSRLVSSLLDLSRIQAGDRKFTMSHFDVCETAKRILISFEQKIDAKHLDVEFDLQEERMYVNADSDAIYQVIYNLCHNAVKFSTEGGLLKLSISRIKGKKIQVEVYNEGNGIAKDELQYVFERFYKSDKSRGLDKTGAGLGLFISKTIIEAHDERIWVESEYGKNCSFKFTLSAE